MFFIKTGQIRFSSSASLGGIKLKRTTFKFDCNFRVTGLDQPDSILDDGVNGGIGVEGENLFVEMIFEGVGDSAGGLGLGGEGEKGQLGGKFF